MSKRIVFSLGSRFRDLASDQRGMVGFIYGLMIMVIFGFAALAVDVSYLHFNRARLQNAADAAALAGASSMLAYGDDLDSVRLEMLGYARANLREEDDLNVAVTASDIVFLRNGQPTEVAPNQVEITLYRIAERQNSVDLNFGPAIGIDTADIVVSARAGLVGADSSKCVKPFIVPTKFEWDDYAEPMGSKLRGNGELDVESVAEMASIEVLGYKDEDKGAEILLKPGDPHDTIVPSHYNLINLPPVNKGYPVPGGAMLRENIASCSGSNSEVAVAPGDELQLEPGNTSGPVKQGINSLINSDSGAYWDAATNSIKGSRHSDPMASERVAIVAFYDPRYPPVSGRTTQMVYQVAAVFIENISGKGDVTARFVEALARSPEETGATGDDVFLFLPRLMLDTSRGG